MCFPVYVPPAKTFIIDKNLVRHSVYYDIELFNKEVGEELKSNPKEMFPGDWCISGYGCIVQLQDRQVKHYKEYNMHWYYFPNFIYKIKEGKKSLDQYKMNYSHFGKLIPLSEFRRGLRDSRLIIELMKQQGMDFMTAFRVAHVNCEPSAAASVYNRLIKNRKFLEQLTLLEAVLESNNSLKDKLEKAGLTENEYMNFIVKIIKGSSDHPVGVVTKAMSFVESALTANVQIEAQKKPQSEEIEVAKDELMKEMRVATTPPNQEFSARPN